MRIGWERQGQRWSCREDTPGSGESDALRVEDAGEICTEPQMLVVRREERVMKVRAKCQGPQMAAEGIQSSTGRHLSQGMGTESADSRGGGGGGGGSELVAGVREIVRKA